MPATTAHPTSAALLAYGQGRLSVAEMSAIESHLAECSSCCEALESTPDDTLLIRAREAATSGYRAREQTVAAARAAPPREIPQPLRDHPRYRVLGLIGAGGMGAVYKAEHRKMERLVALKVINPAFVSSPAALERFEREVKTAAKLSHPNIVAAHDADAAGELHFLVMEFVEGMSLDRLVASKGPLPPNVAANLIYQAALGLQHAHEKGMIHRDIKPQNLMRTRDGTLKILDLGLARLATQALQSVGVVGEEDAAAAERPADATRAGSLLGTPDYIAPEQATDAHLADIRADIYSLGCTLYFLLTAEPPFVGGTLLDKLHAHKTCTPTPIQLRRPEVSDELAAVLDQMLAKDPADRFARPADLAKALKPIAQAKPVATSTSELKANVLPSPTVIAEADPQPAAALPIVRKSLPTSIARQSPDEVSPLVWIGAAATAVLMIFTIVWLLSGAGTSGDGKLTQAQQNAAKVTTPPDPPKQDDSKNKIAPKNTTPPKVISQQSITQPKAVVSPSTRNQPVLMVLPTRWLFYPDYDLVQKSLARKSMRLETAAISTNPVGYADGGAGPANFRPERELSKVRAQNYSAIIFAGYKAEELTTPGTLGYAETARLLREFQAANKPIGALCAGQHVPAAHGLFRGRRITGGQYAEGFAEVTGSGATLTHRNIEVDGKLLTGSLASDGPEMVDRLVEMLGR
jgi:serine/threonine protein kinase